MDVGLRGPLFVRVCLPVARAPVGQAMPRVTLHLWGDTDGLYRCARHHVSSEGASNANDVTAHGSRTMAGGELWVTGRTALDKAPLHGRGERPALVHSTGGRIPQDPYHGRLPPIAPFKTSKQRMSCAVEDARALTR